ncbi:MAG: hypothetical protein HYU83_01490 [Chloroflexi bacterium]|nr:hypothetical protein [Chloroflexota bacterium]
MKNLAATGTNWISLMFEVWQETIASTEVARNQFATASDSALRRMIDLAHSLGMRVMLNPVVMLSQDPTHGHVQIGTAFTTEEQWQAWFASYRQIIIYYATLSQDAGADIFYIGNELRGTVHREADWRSIAQEVRQVYKGPIIYEATTLLNASLSSLGEDLQITWWDAVDYIGVLGYFPLTQSNNPTVEELKSAWVANGYLSRLESLSQKFQRPIIISEIGYLSADGTSTGSVPFSKFAQAQIDQQEQADCYQAALEVLWGKPWLAGIFWFQWFVNPNEPTPIGKDRNESPQGKLAEEVLRKFYLTEGKPK